MSNPVQNSFSEGSSPFKRLSRINIAFASDHFNNLEPTSQNSVVIDCIRQVCASINANFVLVPFQKLASSIDEANALDAFYDADAVIVDMTLQDHRNAIYYHLGVRESFSMKQNFLLMAEESLEDSKQIASTLPSYPLFIYKINENGECIVVQSSNDKSDCKNENAESCANDKQIDLMVGQKFVTRLERALLAIEWQTKTHMKEKFLSDLRKAREDYKGRDLADELKKLRRRLEDPDMISSDVVCQMLLSFREVQDYDAMVQLVDDLSQLSDNKVTSAPSIVFNHAFALNRRHKDGDSDRALAIITKALETEEHRVPDSICLCGRIFKDRFIESGYEDKASLNSAIDWYRKGFEIRPNEYAAINLATLLYIAGHQFSGSSELQHIGLVLNNLIGRKGPVHKLQDYWDVATLFEFCVLAGQYSKAIQAAECMFNLKPPKWHLKSTIDNIKLIYQFKPKTETIASPEEQVVEFWIDYFNEAALEPNQEQIRYAALVLEPTKEYMPTYVTLNLDAEEKSITISQICIAHLYDIHSCRRLHLWEVKGSGIRGISSYKRDERCTFLYVHDNSDDFQIFFPSEAIRSLFHSMVLRITPHKTIDMSSSSIESERHINYEYELDPNSSRIVLGKGSRGIVYAASDLDTQQMIAIKEVPVKNSDEVQPLHEEIRLHSSLRHRNIVQYLGTQYEDNYFKIIMERVPGGSLSQLLQQQWGPLRENVIALYSRQILDGLQYLHRQKIVHRDIKGDNVLVNIYTSVLKISDFGTCKRLAAINPNTESFAGTVPFMAPELLDRGARGYSMPADIWSFGCTVIEMATGKPPFIEVASGAQVMFRVGFYKEHPEIPERLNDKARQFILRCFDPVPESRATCEQLLTDAFLEDHRCNERKRESSISTPSTPGASVDSNQQNLTQFQLKSVSNNKQKGNASMGSNDTISVSQLRQSNSNLKDTSVMNDLTMISNLNTRRHSSCDYINIDELIRRNRELNEENAQLWTKLVELQQQLNELLKISVDEKTAQLRLVLSQNIGQTND
ncbi:Mitogen-activated protein kinase kinase kinase 15, partial [Fragariocoptes setiger]